MATFSNFKSTLVAAADTAAGASSAATTVVADINALIALTGMSDGDQAFVTSNNNLYFYSSGWYKIATVSNDSPSAITGVSGSYALDISGGTTVITAVSSDPEGFPLTWSYSTTGLGSIATISQSSNVFTITPSTNTANAGSFTLTISVTDGINGAVSASSTLTLQFVVANSNYTAALITAVDTSDNNNITDASSNNHSITVAGDATAGTFSPYRVGGYSTYFGSNSNTYLTHSGSNFSLPSGGSASWTVECWVNLTSASTNQGIFQIGSITGFGILTIHANTGYVGADTQNGRLGGGSNSNATISSNTWTHLAVVKDGNTIYFYRNGVMAESTADSSDYSGTSNFYVGLYYDTPYCMRGYIRDLRVSSVDRYGSGSSSFTPPTEAFTSDSDTILLTCKDGRYGDLSSNSYSITPVGSVSVSTYNSLFDHSPYAANSNGGSIYFDGNGDYLTPASNVIDFGSSDQFTVEFWVYFTDLAGTSHDMILGSTSSNNYIGYKSTSNQWELVGASNTFFNYTHVNDQWYHVVIQRNNSSLATMFINGQSISGTTTTNNSAFQNTHIGRCGAYTTHDFQGYMSDIKITKGSVLYTSNFTPPTSPLSSSGATLHIKGTDASIIDKAQTSNVTLAGNTTGSTGQTKFASTKSMYFDGNGDSLSITPGYDDPIYNFGTADWTIEVWAYIQTLSSGRNLISFLRASTNEAVPHFYTMDTGLRYYVNNADVITTSSVLSLNTWHHIALTRNGNDHKIFVDGTHVGSTWTNSITYVQGRPVLGDYHSSLNNLTGATNTLHGYAQDLRITKGLARYTSNFTPPTSELQG
jgi:hypothetical protein